MHKSKFRFFLPFTAVILLGQGCFGGQQTAGPDGGVWKTPDRAETWEQKRALVTGAKVTADAALISVFDLEMDPQDRKAIYLGTGEQGMMMSLDSGDSWRKVTSLGQQAVRAVAVDAKDKCTVYAASQNKIYKTDNCTRDWKQVFYDPRTDKVMTDVTVDWFNSLIVYAGTSDGDILKSEDGGKSWKIVKRVDGTPISTIVISPHDSRLVFVGTQGSGVWKTLDGGRTWLEIRKQFGDELRDARRVTQLVLDPKNENRIYLVAQKAGIIRSDDQGENWVALNLPAPPGSFTINALAVDPRDPNTLVFTGPTTFTISSDAGNTWTAKKLPTTSAGTKLLIDPQDSTIFLGTRPQQQ